MKKLLVAGILALFLTGSAMAGNYNPGSVGKSAIAATDTSASINARGYNELAIHTVFATCTGSTNNDTLMVQTSNDGVTWVRLFDIAVETNSSAHSGDVHFDYVPDTNNAMGFGRYIRFRFACANSPSVSFTIYYEFKE